MASGYLRKWVILFVEDCEEIRELHARAFEAAGVKVRIARTIDIAEAMLAEGPPPDLIVMDRELPDGDGFALGYRLKSDRATADIPIIGFTATSADEAMRAAHSARLDGFVAKPCAPDKLVALARVLLETSARARTA